METPRVIYREQNDHLAFKEVVERMRIKTWKVLFKQDYVTIHCVVISHRLEDPSL